ncbi:MAG: asparagine synthase-related protein [Planctomycetota bacterium]
MCGLIAFCGADVQGVGGWAGAMRAIARRGPDGRGEWTAPTGRARLGHTRLAVRDLSDAGAQPMVSGDGDRAIVFNGEIYNAGRVRERLERGGVRFVGTSDTEVVLHAVCAWGFERTLGEIEGIFALAVWDDTRGELCAAVDHAGVKPLAWCERDGGLALGSTCDAVRALLDRAVAIDPIGLRSVLTFGYCPSPRTVWSGVSRLAPGTMLRWRPGEQTVVTRWWRPPEPDGDAGEGWFPGVWGDVLDDERASDVPIGVFLSSGLDSASVACGLAACGADPLCVTVGMEVDDESPRAASIARAVGLRHRVVRMADRTLEEEIERASGVYDEPQGFSALLTQRRLCEAAREHGSVFLGGDGADELLCGYRWHARGVVASMHEMAGRAHLRAASGALSDAVASPDADDTTRRRALGAQGAHGFVASWALNVFPGFHYAEACALTPGLDDGLDAGERLAVMCAPFRSSDRDDLGDLARLQRLDLAHFCAASILPKVDRASMWYGVEVRTPMLNRRLVERTLAHPPVVAGKGELRAYLERRCVGGNVNAKKQGFSLRGAGASDWRRATERLASSALVTSGVLRPDWDAFVPRGDHLELLRLQTLCLVASWAEGRL